MKKQRCVDLLLISAMLLLLFATGGVQAQDDSYSPVKNIDNPQVQEMGQFTVKEYNRESKGELKFVKVLNGEKQEVAGYNYKLIVLAAENGSISTSYEVVVWEDPQHVSHLVSFNHVMDN